MTYYIGIDPGVTTGISVIQRGNTAPLYIAQAETRSVDSVMNCVLDSEYVLPQFALIGGEWRRPKKKDHYKSIPLAHILMTYKCKVGIEKQFIGHGPGAHTILATSAIANWWLAVVQVMVRMKSTPFGSPDVMTEMIGNTVWKKQLKGMGIVSEGKDKSVEAMMIELKYKMPKSWHNGCDAYWIARHMMKEDL